MNATFIRRELLADRIYTFYFKPEQPVRYVAGEFTEIYLPHDNADDRGIRRWFTLSSSPTEELLSITVKFNDNGSSFKKRLLNLQPGASLKLADPMGDFVLPKDTTIPIVFVAVGIGVTPIRSMVKWLTDRNEQRNIQLLYATGTVDGLAFRQLLSDYALKLTTIVKRPTLDYLGETGTLDAARVLGLTIHDDRTLFYLSGPETVVEAITKDLAAKGINPHNIITDYFHGYK